MAEQAELVPRGHRRPDDPPGDPALDVRAGGFYRRGGGGEPRDLRLAAGCRRCAHRKGRFRSGLSFALHPALSVARAIQRSAWKRNSAKFTCRILHIRPYRAGAMRYLAAPLDRMLPQHVVGLDKDSLS